MNPRGIEDPTLSQDDNLSTPVQLALLNQKLDITLANHGTRIEALERWKESKNTKTAAVVAPYLSAVLILLTLAGMLVWK